MPKINTASEYIKSKEKLDECYVEGCTNKQLSNDYVCEIHEPDDDIFMHECGECRIRIPIFLEHCSFHGGTTYHIDMKDKLMSAVTPVTFVSKLKNEAKEAAAKIATDNFVSATRTQVLNLLSKSGIDAKTTKKIAGFIETDLGRAIYTVLLSGLMSALPEKVGPVDTVEMASQLRVKAIAEFGDSAMNLFFPALMQVFSTLSLPVTEEVAVEVPVVATGLTR